MKKMSAISSTEVKNEEDVGPEVFINFRGEELRPNFISHLHAELKRQGINAFIDTDEDAGEELVNLLRRIENSRVALAVLSSRYTESHWCLDELVKITECVDRRTLRIIPIFYKLKTSTVKELKGDFGDKLWNLWRNGGPHRGDNIIKWDAALQDVAAKSALILEDKSDEQDFLAVIIKQVRIALTKESTQREENPELQGGRGENPETQEGPSKEPDTEPGEQRLKQLKERLHVKCNKNKTLILGVVGMAGIGKTYLAKKLFEKLKKKISSQVFIESVREKSKAHGLDQLKLQKTLVEGLLVNETINCDNKNALEVWKDSLLQKKVAVVLDDVKFTRNK